MRQYIIEFDDQLNDRQKKELLQDAGAENIGNIFRNFELVYCDENIAETLKQLDNVVTVELNGYSKKTDAETADFPMQMIDVMGNAHEKGYRGDGIVVAVIDTGINYEHEDLQFPIYKCARILDNTVVSVDVLSDVKDTHKHGTAVASVIAMQDNDKGYVGVAPNVKMMIINAATENGGMSTASQAKAIVWAVDNGADVINISYSQPTTNSAVSSACQYAYDNNVSVVAAAGNEGASLTYSGSLTSEENVNFWKDYPGVVVVGGVKRRENWAGKLLPELPNAYVQYEYALIYYNKENKRYRLVLSDAPMTIDAESGNYHKLSVKRSNEVFDLFATDTNMKWVTYNVRTNYEYAINFASGYLGVEFPIVFSNFNLVDNQKGGIINTAITPMEVFKSHIVEGYGHLLSDYIETDLTKIIKSPSSSFGRGIDFVAPGYFNLAGIDANNTYRYGMGTSFSSPFVAGIIAILRQRFPDITVDRIYSLLKGFVITVDDGNTDYYGNGLVTMPDLSLEFITRIYYKGKENELAKALTF